MEHGRRFYRHHSPGKGTAFDVRLHTTDLHIIADSLLYDESYRKLEQVRNGLEAHIKNYPEFLTSLSPVEQPVDCPEIAAMMYRASALTGTGPMAAVAGAIAELVGGELLKYSSMAVVENGGDVWLSINEALVMAIYADSLYFRDNLAVRIHPERTPCSVCTSSSKLGHSLSFGRADSATVIASDGALADAAATMVCNMVQSENNMEEAVAAALGIPGVSGAIVVYRDRIAAMGDIELAPPG